LLQAQEEKAIGQLNATQKKNVPPSTVSEPPENSENTIAFVDTDDSKRIVTNNTILKISKIGTSTYNLVALLDTGNPIFFILRQTFINFFGLAETTSVSSCSNNALNGIPIQIKNLVTTSIEVELLPKTVSNITLHILENSVLAYNLILRDFFTNNNISFIYTPLGEELENRMQLFSEIATIDVIESTLNKTTNILNDITIDFDSNSN